MESGCLCQQWIEKVQIGRCMPAISRKLRYNFDARSERGFLFTSAGMNKQNCVIDIEFNDFADF